MKESCYKTVYCFSVTGFLPLVVDGRLYITQRGTVTLTLVNLVGAGMKTWSCWKE